ncbi:MAG: translocation/assembly module TamB domain-containing protein [Pyrinomonadaceae bacterium]
MVGSAALANVSFSTFVGSENISVNRINGRLIFTSNQAQIEQLTGYLGGGKLVASGGALLDGLTLRRFRVGLSGQNITAPVADGFLATGNAEIEVSGRKVGDNYDTLISGNINAKRAIYTKDIDLADIIGGRRAGTISEGDSSSGIGVPRLNLTIEGRDALIVRNNIADLTASASLTVGGDFESPIISGRITANEGTIFFRNDRYEIQRGVLEFPPSTGEPFINLQAETEIHGYQIFVNLLGDLSNPDNLSANLRSNPALPQPDVVSLITTGSLANTGTGIPTLAQSGINTAAELLTDSLINNPARKATDKLFGLNKFELDPIISGTRGVSPGARLTVGRQINRNLAITYSTNLSEDQSSVVALEYRVSNRLSFVAQYQQRSLSNVTRNKDNFSFEIRLRKRF